MTIVNVRMFMGFVKKMTDIVGDEYMTFTYF